MTTWLTKRIVLRPNLPLGVDQIKIFVGLRVFLRLGDDADAPWWDVFANKGCSA